MTKLSAELIKEVEKETQEKHNEQFKQLYKDILNRKAQRRKWIENRQNQLDRLSDILDDLVSKLDNKTIDGKYINTVRDSLEQIDNERVS